MSLGEQLRLLREASGHPGWEVAAAAKMDASSLTKIEKGKRLPTAAQLEAFAGFFGVPLGSLEARRLAEDMRRWHGRSPHFAAATAILNEEPGEYHANKAPAAVNKQTLPVNKRKKAK